MSTIAPVAGLSQLFINELNANFAALDTGAINVKGAPYNAVGDGVTDDRPAFVAADAALVARGGGTITVPLPAVSYKLSSDWAASAGVRVVVEGGTASFSTSKISGADIVWGDYSPTAVAGSVMKALRVQARNEDPVFTLKALGGAWPAQPTVAYTGIVANFTDADATSPAFLTPQILYATTRNTTGPAVAQMIVGHGLANNTQVFGGNTVALCAAGLTGIKIVGHEYDIEPGAGATMTGTGAGIYMNGFSVGGLGAAFQIGGIAGGLFSNGFVANAIGSTGTAFTDQAGLSCKYGAYFGNGTYSVAAVNLAGSQYLRFDGNGAALAALFSGDASNNLNVGLGAGLFISGVDNTQGTLIQALRSLGGTVSVQTYVATGAAANAANAAMKVGTNSVTGRSINAGGTINAAGADYAEYERRRDDCGLIAKGAAVGFDDAGLLTDRFSAAVSFAVKSTSPNLVGGDTWHWALAPEPQAPMPPNPPKPEPVKASTIRASSGDNAAYYAAKIEEEYQAGMAEWTAVTAAYQVQLVEHEAAHAEYVRAKAAWDDAFEVERQKVDRIAYCGKVPVNFQDAKPGQYLKAIEGPNDSIGIAVASGRADGNVIGRVRRILDDGRAEIVVML